MELSESEPDSAGRQGERAERRDARYVNNGGKCLGKLSSTGCQHNNWGRLARSVGEGIESEYQSVSNFADGNVTARSDSSIGLSGVSWQMNP